MPLCTIGRMIRCALMLLLAVRLWGQAVADRAEYDKPHQYSVGVHDVLVNGKFVLRQDKVTAERPGRVLPGSSAER